MLLYSIGVLHIPYFGIYPATKHALEGFALSLMEEVEPQGLSVHLVRPTGYNTNLLKRETYEQHWMNAFNRQNDEVKKFYKEAVDKCKMIGFD